MCKTCERMKRNIGYRGQKNAVYFTRGSKEYLMGWQNADSGGLEDAAKLMPGVTSTRVERIHEGQPPLPAEIGDKE